MFKKLIPIIFILSLLLTSCSTNKGNVSILSDTKDSTQASLNAQSSILSPTRDMGQEYIDSFIFLGESTTYHLKCRGVLSGGTETLQVWGPKSGTLMLDPSTASCRVVYPETGEEIDVSEAIKRKKPKYILLTFGLNGATKSISKGEQYFKECYRKLIDTLSSSSPETTVILQSCFPISKNMDMSNYTVSVSTLNQYIDTINEWTSQLAQELSIAYLNTSEILKDKDGYLFESYQVGDGYHLSTEAYTKILDYIRTHGHPKEDSNA